jgi:hypothetical protein
MTPSPYISTSWQWVSTGQMFFVLKKQITERTSQSADLATDMVVYKQQPIHSVGQQTVRLTTAVSLQNLPSLTCVGRPHKWFLL